MSLKGTVLFVEMTFPDLDHQGNDQIDKLISLNKKALSEKIKEYQAFHLKILGNGVFSVFYSIHQAIVCASALVKDPKSAHPNSAFTNGLSLKIGMCHGAIEMVGGDCFGDAVNVAFRLSQLATANEIWADLEGDYPQHLPSTLNCEKLGAIPIHGRTGLSTVLKLIPIESPSADQFTELAPFESPNKAPGSAVVFIDFFYNGASRRYLRQHGPIRIGRADDMDFQIHDDRVSRSHLKIEWCHQGPTVCDLSSFGTWVRFQNKESVLFLRRESCVLHGTGELILSSSLATKEPPILSFQISSA